MNYFVVLLFNQQTKKIDAYPVNAYDKENALLSVGEYINEIRKNNQQPLLDENDNLIAIERKDLKEIYSNMEKFIQSREV